MGSSLSESRVSAFSAISRIKGIAWNTVARWLEKAAQVCRRFNHRRIAGFAAKELQADEIRTFAGNKKTLSTPAENCTFMAGENCTPDDWVTNPKDAGTSGDFLRALAGGRGSSEPAGWSACHSSECSRMR